MTGTATTTGAWPALPYAEWAPTKKTLQMVAQMLGKVRLALDPPQPQWLHTPLYLDGRGFATGSMPWKNRLVEMGIDVFDGVVWITVSDGRQRDVSLTPGRCVADIWADLQRAMDSLGIELDMWDKPQELADTTRFSQNRHDCTIDLGHAQRFYSVLAALQGVYEQFRSPFLGRTGVQFWWGAFDFAVLLFSGRRYRAPDDRGYIMRYDLDVEQLNCGFWPGDDSNPAPMLYGYLHPRPDGCETAAISPEHAGWVESMGEWMMPYDAIRESPDPGALVLEFFNSIYAVAVETGGWDAEEHAYKVPAPSSRK
jgi:hypothetical protein